MKKDTNNDPHYDRQLGQGKLSFDPKDKTGSDKDYETNPDKSQQQFLHKAKVEVTERVSPIQGPVLDAKPLFHFIEQNHDSAVHKFFGVFLDENRMVIGVEPIAFGDHALPERVQPRLIFHFDSTFLSKHFIVLSYRVNATNDPAPTEADRRLIDDLTTLSRMMGSDFDNYVITSGTQYWSMKNQNGTACHCGKQDYIPFG